MLDLCGTNDPRTFEAAVTTIVHELAHTIVHKQRDYGKSNILDFGEHGVLVRSNDKFARLKNLLLNNKEPSNESIEDTWTDVAGYAVIALLLRRGWFELPLGDKGNG